MPRSANSCWTVSSARGFVADGRSLAISLGATSEQSNSDCMGYIATFALIASSLTGRFRVKDCIDCEGPGGCGFHGKQGGLILRTHRDNRPSQRSRHDRLKRLTVVGRSDP